MTLKEMPKVGDKVRFKGRGTTDYDGSVTDGFIYEIIGIDRDGDAFFEDDDMDPDDYSYITLDYFECYELVTEPIEGTPVVASQSVIELLENLALRLTKVEDKIGNDELKPKEANVVADVMTTQSERIESVCNEVRDLLIRKNHDYGDSFSKQFAKYGVMSGLIRMDDKIRRLETLVGGEEAQVSESIEDTIADLAGYALLTLVELRKGAQ